MIVESLFLDLIDTQTLTQLSATDLLKTFATYLSIYLSISQVMAGLKHQLSAKMQ